MHIPEKPSHLLREAVGSTACTSRIRAKINPQRGELGSIEIKQYAGGLANVLWVRIGGRRYAFAYNHNTGEIEIRDRTQSGPAVHSFSNNTPAAEVETVFRAL